MLVAGFSILDKRWRESLISLPLMTGSSLVKIINEVIMENLLIILIIVLAGVYIIRRFWKSAKGDVSCSCGCSSCNNTTCSDEKDVKPIFLDDRMEK